MSNVGVKNFLRITIPFSSNFYKITRLMANHDGWCKNNELNEKKVLIDFKLLKKSFSTDIVKGNDICNADMCNVEERCPQKISTDEDLKTLVTLTKEVLQYRTINDVNSSFTERNVKKFCQLYCTLSMTHKKEFLQVLAGNHTVDRNQVYHTAKTLLESESESVLKVRKMEDQLRNLLTPEYSWIFLQIGKLEKGVKFLVDLRTHVLDLIQEKNAENSPVAELQRLNTTLRDLLSIWFSVGFLELERVTWKSSCEMLQKISEYEAVHPMRNWTDLKRRVGSYRRCFVFLHRSMPGEPIVVLHTALCDEISRSIQDIVSARSRMTADQSGAKEIFNDEHEDVDNIKAAVFYSITSTQRGLHGIELGNYLIKRVVCQLQNEFPHMTQFSSLSPIPSFRAWLLDRLKAAQRGHNDLLLHNEIKELERLFSSSDVFEQLRKLLFTNRWVEDTTLSNVLEIPLMRLCARYLYLEKRRGYALDSVANFHLKNGALMWRLNWKANISPRGLSNSCGIMVNYRYFLEHTETNSRSYLEKQTISSSEQIQKLSEQAKKLMVASKI